MRAVYLCFFVFVLVWGSSTPSSAQVLRVYRVGNYEIREYKNSCFASSPQLTSRTPGYGITGLTFAVFPQSFDLMLTNHLWEMPIGKKARAEVSINGRSFGVMEGEAFTPTALTLKFPQEFIRDLIPGGTIRVAFNLREYEFSLAGSRSGLAGLAECVERKIATVPGAAAPRPTGQLPRASAGSGFFIWPSEYILTNDHVVSGCSNIEVVNYGAAQVVARDQQEDLAVVRVAGGPSHGALFSPEPLKLAERVYAVGYPLSDTLKGSINVTDGIVSSLSGYDGDVRYLQTTAPIQPGNSGGPLVNADGHVIGLVTAKLANASSSGSGRAAPENIAFAIKMPPIITFLNRHPAIPYRIARSGGGEAVKSTVIAETVVPYVVHIKCRRG